MIVGFIIDICKPSRYEKGAGPPPDRFFVTTPHVAGSIYRLRIRFLIRLSCKFWMEEGPNFRNILSRRYKSHLWHLNLCAAGDILRFWGTHIQNSRFLSPNQISTLAPFSIPASLSIPYQIHRRSASFCKNLDVARLPISVRGENLDIVCRPILVRNEDLDVGRRAILGRRNLIFRISQCEIELLICELFRQVLRRPCSVVMIKVLRRI